MDDLNDGNYLLTLEKIILDAGLKLPDVHGEYFDRATRKAHLKRVSEHRWGKNLQAT